jgi:serine/threonine-protein phosphatase 5
LYTEAIEFNPNSAVLYANRSFAHLRTESFGYALEDASKAISLDKTYVKGYYRRAAAYMALGKCKLALKDYESVYKARPNDRDAKLKYNECSKIVRQQAFEKAISVDSVKKLVSETINIDTITVEDSYDGPHLDANGKVTLQFMEELMQRYKDQKKLHKKYACKVRPSLTLTCTTTLKTVIFLKSDPARCHGAVQVSAIIGGCDHP